MVRGKQQDGVRERQHALALLQQILNHAISCGDIEANSARGIRRNPGAKLTRFLSREEIRRLHRVLEGHAARSESRLQQADIIRLSLLTGCRKTEIVRLRRNEVNDDRLEPRDSKTGFDFIPGTVEAIQCQSYLNPL